MIVLCILIVSMPAFAQEWVDFDENTEINCEVVTLITEEYSDEDIARTTSETLTVQEFFESLAEDCFTESDAETVSEETDNSRNVMVDGNVNLRDCAGTSCGIVGQATDGSILEVVAEDGDWYEVVFEGDTAFIASWLTSPTASVIIETDEAHLIEGITCAVAPSARRGDMDMNIIITGGRQGDVLVDLYRPSDQNPLRVEAQYDKAFIDSGDAYIHQVYRWNVSFPTGYT